MTVPEPGAPGQGAVPFQVCRSQQTMDRRGLQALSAQGNAQGQVSPHTTSPRHRTGSRHSDTELLRLLTRLTYQQRCELTVLHVSRYSHRQLLPEGSTAFCNRQEKGSIAQLQSSSLFLLDTSHSYRQPLTSPCQGQSRGPHSEENPHQSLRPCA